LEYFQNLEFQKYSNSDPLPMALRIVGIGIGIKTKFVLNSPSFECKLPLSLPGREKLDDECREMYNRHKLFEGWRMTTMIIYNSDT